MLGLSERLAGALFGGAALLAIAGGIATAVQSQRLEVRTAELAAAHAGVAAEASAHAATVANYRSAMHLALRAAVARVAAVTAEQQRINQEIARDYQARIDDARARAAALRLRQAGNAAAGAGGGSGGGGSLPGFPDDPAGAAQAADEDRFPLADRLIATEQAIQLDALIEAVERNREAMRPPATGDTP